MRSLDIYKKYKSAYQNSLAVIWNMYRKKQLIQVKLKDGSSLTMDYGLVWAYANSIDEGTKMDENLKERFIRLQKSYRLSNDQNGEFLEFDYYNHHCIFYGALENGRVFNGDVSGVFFLEEWRFLNPQGCTVIDVGGNIGDSAIYFALKGAKKVISLEPFPFSFGFAAKNIAINNLANKIELLNAGYGKDSVIKVQTGKSDAASLLIHSLNDSENGKEIRTYSLKTLLDKVSDEDNIVLKMDCEGCEYNLLDEPINLLRRFKRIEIEFHFGYKNLESMLRKAGFSVRLSKPIRAIGQHPALMEMALANKDYTFGWIYAERD